MKMLLFIFLLSPLFSLAQYRVRGDTIFINNKVLVPGDTVHLGVGSDPYKNFVFITHMPNKKVKTAHKLPSDLSLGFLVYKGIMGQQKLRSNQIIRYRAFLLGNVDNSMSHYVIYLPQAIATKEIFL